MKPSAFGEMNNILSAPSNMKKADCAELPVFSNGNVIISCWESSFWDRIRFLFFGEMWLVVRAAKTQYPCYLTTLYPFEGKRKIGFAGNKIGASIRP
jgi:hypothetical protein